MPRMTDELKRYQEARAKCEAATVELRDAAIALAARVDAEGGAVTRRGRKPGPKPKTPNGTEPPKRGRPPKPAKE